MNSTRFRILSFVLAALLGLSGPAAAAGPYVGGNAEDQKLEKQQNLTRQLYEDFYKSAGATRQELIAKSRELEARMYGPNPDEKQILALAKEVSDLRANLYNAHIALQVRLIKEGVMPGYGGPGAGGPAPSCCDEPGGGYGPGMGRGYGPRRGGAAFCCGGGYGPGMGRGHGMRGYGRGCW